MTHHLVIAGAVPTAVYKPAALELLGQGFRPKVFRLTTEEWQMATWDSLSLLNRYKTLTDAAAKQSLRTSQVPFATHSGLRVPAALAWGRGFGLDRVAAAVVGTYLQGRGSQVVGLVIEESLWYAETCGFWQEAMPPTTKVWVARRHGLEICSA